MYYHSNVFSLAPSGLAKSMLSIANPCYCDVRNVGMNRNQVRPLQLMEFPLRDFGRTTSLIFHSCSSYRWYLFDVLPIFAFMRGMVTLKLVTPVFEAICSFSLHLHSRTSYFIQTAKLFFKENNRRQWLKLQTECTRM